MPRKRDRKDQMLAAAQYPIDWVEERSGLIGGLRYFLFRKVPRDSGWGHTLGSATLTAFLVPPRNRGVLAGVYQPGPHSAHQALPHIPNHRPPWLAAPGPHPPGARA